MNKNEIREIILNALEAESFFSELGSEVLKNSRFDLNLVSDVIIELHNELNLNANILFREIVDLDSFDAWDFGRIYANSLPKLNSSVVEVIETVGILTEHGSKVIATGNIYNSLLKFCNRDFSYSVDGLQFVLNDTHKYSSLISILISAASIHNINWCMDMINELSNHPDSNVRYHSYSVINTILFDNETITNVLDFLENVVKLEVNKSLRAGVLKSVASIDRRYDFFKGRIESLLTSILEDVVPEVLYEASLIMFHDDYSELSNNTQNSLIKYLENTSKEQKEIVDNIDTILYRRLNSEEFKSVIPLLECLLINKIEVKVFNSFVNELLRSHRKTFNRLVTKWLLSGDRDLCHALDDMLQIAPKAGVLISADFYFISHSKVNKVFLARKAVGWFRFKAVEASSFIISLIDSNLSSEDLKEIETILFDCLLINNTKEVSDFFESVREDSKQVVKELISRLLDRLEKYFVSLASARHIKELKTSDKNHELYRKNLNEKMRKAYNEASERSIFKDIFTVKHLLYGSGSVGYFYDENGNEKRTTMAMTSSSHEFSVPRMEILDPLGQAFQSIAYRAEKENETNT